MSIENATLSGKAAGNDVATSWTIAISIRDEETVIVEYETVLGVTSTLVLDTDYTVTGITDSGFTLTLISFLLATGEYLHVRSEEEFTQEIPLPAGSTYSSDTHEAAFDKLTRLCQQLKLTLTQCVKLSLSRIGDSTDLEIDEDLVADAYLKVNAGATGLQQVTGVLPDDVTVTPYMETILDAASAAAVRTLLVAPATDFLSTFVNNSNGNPNISDTPQIIFTHVTPSAYVVEATWTTIGPTGSGADIEWAALDDLPEDVDWIVLRYHYLYYGNSGANDATISVYMRAEDSTEAIDDDKNRVVYQWGDYSGSHQFRCSGSPVVNVPVTDRAFGIYWDMTNFIYGSAKIVLVGAGYNSLNL